MTNDQKTTDITIRGGLLTLIPNPPSTKPPRHQPNTPINKKFAPPKPPAKKPKPKTKTITDLDSEPPPGESDNVAAPPS